MKKACIFAILALSLFSFSTAAFAQVYTYVTHWDVPRDQWGAFNDYVQTEIGPILDGLVEDGTIIHWGLEEAFVHREGERTHGMWWAASGLDGITKAQDAAGAAPASPVLNDLEGHHDHLSVSSMHGGRTASGASGYSQTAIFRVLPGKESEWNEVWETYMKPYYDGAVSAGDLLLYEVGEESIHTGDPQMRYLWWISPSAEAFEKVGAGFAEIVADNPAINDALEATHDRSAHSDRFNTVHAYAHR